MNKVNSLVLMTINGITKTRIEYFGMKLPKFTSYLRIWRETIVTKVKSNISPKLKDKGVPYLFLGYIDNYKGDCYCTWDLVGYHIYIVRDIV